MNFQNIIFSILYFLTISNSYGQDSNYYIPAIGLTGQNLKSALHNIILKHKYFPLASDKTWSVLSQSDKDKSNTDNVILLYTGWSVNATALDSNNDRLWQKEHVWSVSHGNLDNFKEAYSDLHNLKPINASVNVAKRNKDFDNGGKSYVYKTDTTDSKWDTDKGTWEPRDKDKGDVARIMFYMAVRYEGENEDPDLELLDTIHTDKLIVTGKGFYGKLCTLLKWNKEDPVDSFEVCRNDTIYSYQKNRNPFIDHPEFVDLIWAKECVVGNETIFANEPPIIQVYPNPASDYIFIELPSPNLTQVELFSILGKRILQFEITHSYKLSVEYLNPGIYILSVSRRNSIQREKVIIQ